MIAPRPSDRLSAVAATSPSAAKVFHRHGLDLCCGGAQTLSAACENAQLDVQALIAELQAEAAEGTEEAEPIAARPPAELIAFIVERYHAPLRPELERLQELALTVARVHADQDPERLTRIAHLVVGLRSELLQHMRKEEDVLFPWILSGQGPAAGAPIALMEREHEVCGEHLRQLAALTDGYCAPPGACATWRALYGGLGALDLELKDHMHLENNVLFPRALLG